MPPACHTSRNAEKDPSGHGTHILGLVGAVGNNGVGVTSVARSVSLYVCAARTPDVGCGWVASTGAAPRPRGCCLRGVHGTVPSNRAARRRPLPACLPGPDPVDPLHPPHLSRYTADSVMDCYAACNEEGAKVGVEAFWWHPGGMSGHKGCVPGLQRKCCPS